MVCLTLPILCLKTPQKGGSQKMNMGWNKQKSISENIWFPFSSVLCSQWIKIGGPRMKSFGPKLQQPCTQPGPYSSQANNGRTLNPTIPCYTTPHHFIHCHTMPYNFRHWHTIPYHTLPYHTITVHITAMWPRTLHCIKSSQPSPVLIASK